MPCLSASFAIRCIGAGMAPKRGPADDVESGPHEALACRCRGLREAVELQASTGKRVDIRGYVSVLLPPHAGNAGYW